MVNFRNPVVTAQAGLAFEKLWHVLSGIYFWEFVTTLDYEWRVVRGRLPYRWSIWVYSLTRVACLVGVIFTLTEVDVTNRIPCQFWISTITTSFLLSLSSASLLIILRTIAIWINNKVVMATVISLWVIGVAFHIQDIVRYRSVWVPALHSCSSAGTKKGVLGLLPTIFVDLILLIIMFVGLVILRRHGYGRVGLTHFLWKQAVVWLLLAFVSEAPQAVMAVFSSNEQFIEMIVTPGTITTIIAATRMHRSLIDFASSPPGEATLGTLELGTSVALSTPKPAQPHAAAPTLPNRIEVEVAVH
ncbi:hypothetical protein BJV77DRAFT_140345 [Russula vinacea]|nr:hypothetical protein BJV77DRAFT_140345 [Russula vinacea]